MQLAKTVATSVRSNEIVRTIVDFAMVPIVVLAGIPLRLFRGIGVGSLPNSLKALRRVGIYPVRDHYYEPLFNDAHLKQPLGEPRDLPAISWRHDQQIAFLERLDRREELFECLFQVQPRDGLTFVIENESFASGDAEFLYQFIRHVRPERVIEIGSGESTKVASIALRRNARESGRAISHTCIEPYEAAWLESLDVQVIRSKVEHVGVSLFRQLSAGDLLFIDSSHMIRPQGDVLFEFFDILPALQSGVFVHIHDIFSPRDYPDGWIRDEVRMWNEQYLLEALLSNTSRYEIVAALNYLKHSEYERLLQVCPFLEVEREPGSFYIQVK